jgi:ATP-binding cassette subfamily B multidrug efflux pump
VRQTVKDLWHYIRQYPKPFLIGILGLIVSSYFTTLTPIIIGNALDALREGVMSFENVWRYIGALLGVTATAALSMIIVRRTILNASWEIQFDIRRDLFLHFTRLDAEYYDNNRVGDLMARLTADLNAVRMMVGVGIFMGMNTSLILIITLWRMFNLNVNLSLLTMVIVPFITLSFFILLRIIHRRYERVQEQFGDVSAMAQENFSGIRVVKGFGIEDRELSAFEKLNNEFIRRNLALTKVDGPLFPLMEMLFGVTMSLLILVGGRIVLGIGGTLTIGQLAAFIFLFTGIEWPIIALGWIGNVMQRGITSWGRLKDIFQEQPMVQDGELTDYSLTAIKGEISFEDVTLIFGEQKALDNVSFTVRAGETIGITGRTGAGKTMIVNLITRIIEPTSGTILVDGRDIRQYPVEVLRRFIGLVPQEPFLFSDSIAENISYGLPEDTGEVRSQRIDQVAELVQLKNDVNDFPQGFDTSLGERGVTLSGGQRQRTAMARAIIRDPAILILDDALSAVDTQTEARILTGLESVTKGRTTIIVAHRVSAFQNCDRILVLEDGRLIEQGSHDELIRLDGWYADIDRRQQLEEDLEAA